MQARQIDYQQLVQDFLLVDRRLGDRPDLRVDLKFQSPWAMLKGLPAITAKMEFRKSEVSIYRLPNGLAVLSLFGVAPLLEQETQMFGFLGRLVQCFEKEARGERPYDPVIGSTLKEVRESISMSLSDLARQFHKSQSILSKYESALRMPRTKALYAWCQALGLVCRPKTALVRVVDFSPDLLRFLQEDPTRLRSLSPDQFERFTAERLDRMGYNVTLTGATNRKDGGIDLIAVPKLAALGSYVIAGQVKHHRGDQTTGVDAVDRLLAWKDSVFRAGLLVTNTSFTNDAVWKAHKDWNAHFLRLRDFSDLKRWLQDQYGSDEDWREIPDRIELAPGIVVEIPRPRIISPFDLNG